MNEGEARLRLLADGQLCRVIGPRRQEIATLRIDDQLPRGDVVLRDVLGAAPSEIIRIQKLDIEK